MTEDLINLVGKLLGKKGKMHIDHILKGLEDEFQISVDKQTLEFVMSESERRNKVLKIEDAESHWVNIEE